MEVKKSEHRNNSHLLGLVPLILGTAGMVFVLASIDSDSVLDLLVIVWGVTVPNKEKTSSLYSVLGRFVNPFLTLLCSSVLIALGFIVLEEPSNRQTRMVWLRNAVLHVVVDVGIVALFVWGVKYFGFLEADQQMEDKQLDLFG